MVRGRRLAAQVVRAVVAGGGGRRRGRHGRGAAAAAAARASARVRRRRGHGAPGHVVGAGHFTWLACNKYNMGLDHIECTQPRSLIQRE